jgi:leucyl-tRNA synthetase
MSKRLGNADPFETAEYGPDATRWYMISNANPWDNLKFDLEGIAEVRRKFFEPYTIPIRSLVCMLTSTDFMRKLKFH